MNLITNVNVFMVAIFAVATILQVSYFKYYKMLWKVWMNNLVF